MLIAVVEVERNLSNLSAETLGVFGRVLVRHEIRQRRQHKRSKAASIRSRLPQRILRHHVSEESLRQILSLMNVPHFASHIGVKRLPVLLAQLRQSQFGVGAVKLSDDAPVRRTKLSLPDVGWCCHDSSNSLKTTKSPLR